MGLPGECEFVAEVAGAGERHEDVKGRPGDSGLAEKSPGLEVFAPLRASPLPPPVWRCVLPWEGHAFLGVESVCMRGGSVVVVVGGKPPAHVKAD